MTECKPTGGTKMSELQPCPFCGADDADYMPDRLMAIGADPPVFCNQCHASAVNAAAWNRRAPGWQEGAEAMRETAERVADERADRHLRALLRLPEIQGQSSIHRLEHKNREALDIAAAIRALPLPEPPK